jgi:hypothetical protein
MTTERRFKPTDPDGERWRFLVDHSLSLQHTAGGDCMVNLVRTGEPPKIQPVSIGPTAAAAIDSARARYEHALDHRNRSPEGEK